MMRKRLHRHWRQSLDVKIQEAYRDETQSYREEGRHSEKRVSGSTVQRNNDELLSGAEPGTGNAPPVQISELSTIAADHQRRTFLQNLAAIEL